MKRVYLSLLVSIFLISTSSAAWAAGITGAATYDGEVPNLRPIKMDADPVCMTKHDSAVYPEVLVLGPDNSMQYVFVRVISGLPKKDYPAPQEPVELAQNGCMYDPHVLGLQVGQPLKILNPDGTLHNVHALPKINEEFNLAMPKFRKEVTKTFNKVEFMFPFKCDVHPWMQAWISVLDHPYFDTTDKEGKYTIDDLPPGEYEIEAWHEKLGTQTATVTLAEGDNKEINFSFSRPSK